VDKEGKVGYFDTDSEGEIPVQGSFGNTFVDFFFHASKEREGCLRDMPLSDELALHIVQTMVLDSSNWDFVFCLIQLKEGVSFVDLCVWPEVCSAGRKEGVSGYEGPLAVCFSKKYRLYFLLMEGLNPTKVCALLHNDWNNCTMEKLMGFVDLFDETILSNLFGVESFEAGNSVLYESMEPNPSLPMRLQPPFSKEVCMLPFSFEQLCGKFSLERYLCALSECATGCRNPSEARRDAKELKSDEERVEALFKAIDKNDYSMAAVLLEMYDVSPLSKNKDGVSAIDYAERHPDENLSTPVQYPYEWGATILQMLRLVMARNR
jgi:hypothetical protein